MKAAAAAMVPKTPADQRISLIYAPGKESYPIINYEYAVVKADQPNVQVAGELKTLLSWAVASTGGNAETYMRKVNFVPLPANAARQSLTQIDKIHG